MRALALLLCLVAGQAWGATWHVCPSKDAINGSLTYGAGDGTSQADCWAGFAAITGTSAGDTVQVHGTYYHEKLEIPASGSSAAQLIFTFDSDALAWFSIDVSGIYTMANSTNTQTTGTAWALVSGTANIWKKGIGTSPYLMWVDGTQIDHASVVPATQNDAGAIAVLSPGQFISTSEDLNTFSNTLYYYGTPTSKMRVNNMGGGSQSTNVFGDIIINGQSYVTLQSPRIKGYYPFAFEWSALSIQSCTGCVVTNPVIWDGSIGIKATANTNLTISGSACEIYNNTHEGISIAGQYQVQPAGVITQVAGISKANPGVVTTVSDFTGLLSTGDHIIMQGVSGMTQVAAVEYTATVVDGTHFSIGVDTSAFGAWTSGGIVWIQKTDSGTTVKDCYIHNNGNYARYNGISITYNQDGDGLGVGYLGGTVNSITVKNNKIWNNGPRRALLAGESTGGGSIAHGSGMTISTSYSTAMAGTLVASNDFYNNHRQNFIDDESSSGIVEGNLFRGTVNYGATAGYAQLKFGSVPSTSVHYAINNTFTSECPTSCLSINNNVAATKTYIASNNNFYSITGNVGTGADAFDGIIFAGSSQNTVTADYNNLNTINSLSPYKRSSTQYSTAATWGAAWTPTQAANDKTVDPGFVGGTSPTTAAGFHLSGGSALRRAGVDLNIGNVQDCENEAFGHPPDIGACGTNSGDEAAVRSARP